MEEIEIDHFQCHLDVKSIFQVDKKEQRVVANSKE